MNMNEIYTDYLIWLKDQGYSGSVSEMEKAFLTDQGYTFQMSKSWQRFLQDSGYTGESLPILMKQWVLAGKPVGASGISFLGAGSVWSVGTDTGQTTDVDVTSFGLQQNDLLVAFVARGGNSPFGVTAMISAGWTTPTGSHFGVNAGGAYDTATDIYYKFMGVTPDTVVQADESNSATNGIGMIVWGFRGVDLVTPLDASIVNAGITNTTVADPGAITTVTDGAVVLAMNAGGAGAPVAYTDPGVDGGWITAEGNETYSIQLGGGYYLRPTAGLFDPSAPGGGNSATNLTGGARTLALRPVT